LFEGFEILGQTLVLGLIFGKVFEFRCIDVKPGDGDDDGREARVSSSSYTTYIAAGQYAYSKRRRSTRGNSEGERER
jgi:hypothetical protein